MHTFFLPAPKDYLRPYLWEGEKKVQQWLTKNEGRAEASEVGEKNRTIWRSTKKLKGANPGWPYTAHFALNGEMDPFCEVGHEEKLHASDKVEPNRTT